MNKENNKEKTPLQLAQESMEAHSSKAIQDPFYPAWHISAPSGWINDPNGLIQMNGIYHVFYQLHPYSAEWGPMHWGHVSSHDLVHWQHEPIALAPDQPYESGCFSGSAVNDNGILTLIYTAHKNNEVNKETQCIARSFDNGKTFQKIPENPVIAGPPADGTADFRDPKVWFQDGCWQMVIGSGKNEIGRALIYISDDLIHWKYRGIMCESDGTQGTLWECPNFCTVDGTDILIVSPLRMKGYKNFYCIGERDSETGKFSMGKCRELDYGISYYAAQVFQDERGRVLLFSWMDMWRQHFPTQPNGWAGMLTLPRVLHMRGSTLLQQPVPELALLRQKRLLSGSFTLTGKNDPLRTLQGECLEIFFTFRPSALHSGFKLGLRVSHRNVPRTELIYDRIQNTFLLIPCSPLLDNASPRPAPCESENELLDVHIFIDCSSIEIFIDEGAICISQRIYPDKDSIYYDLTSDEDLKFDSFDVWSLKTVMKPSL